MLSVSSRVAEFVGAIADGRPQRLPGGFRAEVPRRLAVGHDRPRFLVEVAVAHRVEDVLLRSAPR